MCIENTAGETEASSPMPFIFCWVLDVTDKPIFFCHHFASTRSTLGIPAGCTPATLAAEVELTATASNSTRLTPAKIRSSLQTANGSWANPPQRCCSQRLVNFLCKAQLRFIPTRCLGWRRFELRERGARRPPQPHQWLFGMFRWTIVGRSCRFATSTALANVFSVPRKPFTRHFIFNITKIPGTQTKIK